ncbi:MAG: response regulator of the LytR/AlgR family [Bacteroidetes bacterium]|jgi:DNA-binding LytR/AlgR family response regulator|nr:response regulator of the LytR/AlgR family [Bacteroidota bacterium]
MDKINCIAVDDEPLALEYISKHIARIPELKLLAKCKNVASAQDILKKEKIDLIFLDIQMPGRTGLDLAKHISEKQFIVFTTAYEKYAVEGFEVNAIDYLLKPIEFVRFKKACDKVIEQINLRQGKTEESYILVKSEYQNVKIFLKDIVYVEGLKDYVKIFLLNQPKPLLSRQNLKTFETQIPTKLFSRIHKSYIISNEKVSAVNKMKIFIGEKEFPLGDAYKEQFLKRFS